MGTIQHVKFFSSGAWEGVAWGVGRGWAADLEAGLVDRQELRIGQTQYARRGGLAQEEGDLT